MGKTRNDNIEDELLDQGGITASHGGNGQTPPLAAPTGAPREGACKPLPRSGLDEGRTGRGARARPPRLRCAGTRSRRERAREGRDDADGARDREERVRWELAPSAASQSLGA